VDGHLNIIMGCQGDAGLRDDSTDDGVLDELKMRDHVITEFNAAGVR
jgi:hypothetical protein